MGLKPLLASNTLLTSGMDNEAVQKNNTMIIKTDSVAQPNGSPLLSPAVAKDPLHRTPAVDLIPLRVDVNGFRQPSSTLVSPSSLVSTALPTPLIDFESNSNCSDSNPQGDLYPPTQSKGAIDFGAFTMPKQSPGFPLKSPVTTYSYIKPSTSGTNLFIARPPVTKMQPQQLTAQQIQRRNGDINRKNFVDKVTRHKSNLKFIIPKCSEANPSQLSIMLKKARKYTVLAAPVDKFLFEEQVIEKPKPEPRKRRTLLEDPYVTDVSDKETEPTDDERSYKKQRNAEKQLILHNNISTITCRIEERQRKLNQLLNTYNKDYKTSPTVDETIDLPAARCRPFIRRPHRNLIKHATKFHYDETIPSTSKDTDTRAYIKKVDIPVEETAMDLLHWLAMNPSFNSRRNLNRPPHLLEQKDLEEEMARNGTTRRLEKEKRRIREEDRKNNRDSSDYEDTDEDLDYYPEIKGSPIKKKRKRGRPPRQERKDGDQPPSKIGRRPTITKHVQLYEGELILDLTQIALSDEKPKYAQIQIPAFSVISDESLTKQTDECEHGFPNLIEQHTQFHPILEKEERMRYTNPSKKPARISVDKDFPGPQTPLPSPVSYVKPAA